MTAPRLIRLTSRALGPQLLVRIYVYDDLAAMLAAAERFNGNDNTGAVGVTQAYVGEVDGERFVLPIVRLVRGKLSATVVAHEVHHATTALFGAYRDQGEALDDVLTHYNEPYAHLFSDVYGKLVEALYRHGYYE